MAALDTAARETLLFAAAVSRFQAETAHRLKSFDDIPEKLPDLLEALVGTAPGQILSVGRDLSADAFRNTIRAYWEQRDTRSPKSLLARIVLQPYAYANPARKTRAASGRRGCPVCGHPPQLAVRRRQGHGQALHLVCSLCLKEWPFSRGCCPGCGATSEASLSYFASEERPELEVQACTRCKQYLLSIDLSSAVDIVADIDEMRGLALDIWCAGKGYRKIQPNLAGL